MPGQVATYILSQFMIIVVLILPNNETYGSLGWFLYYVICITMMSVYQPLIWYITIKGDDEKREYIKKYYEGVYNSEEDLIDGTNICFTRFRLGLRFVTCVTSISMYLLYIAAPKFYYEGHISDDINIVVKVAGSFIGISIVALIYNIGAVCVVFKKLFLRFCCG